MRALIISAGESKNIKKLKEYYNNSDYVICADGGYDYARYSGIKPDILIGDFDSIKSLPEDIPIIKLKCEKDETDTLYALRYALDRGANEIVVYGGLGNRFDHSFANLCIIFEALSNNASMLLTDGKTRIYGTMDKIKIEGKSGEYVSVFSFSEISYGVSIKGLKYCLSDYNLKNTDILCVSNEFTDKIAEISVDNGKLLIICN